MSSHRRQPSKWEKTTTTFLVAKTRECRCTSVQPYLSQPQLRLWRFVRFLKTQLCVALVSPSTALLGDHLHTNQWRNRFDKHKHKKLKTTVNGGPVTCGLRSRATVVREMNVDVNLKRLVICEELIAHWASMAVSCEVIKNTNRQLGKQNQHNSGDECTFKWVWDLRVTVFDVRIVLVSTLKNRITHRTEKCVNEWITSHLGQFLRSLWRATTRQKRKMFDK